MIFELNSNPYGHFCAICQLFCNVANDPFSNSNTATILSVYVLFKKLFAKALTDFTLFFESHNLNSFY